MKFRKLFKIIKNIKKCDTRINENNLLDKVKINTNDIELG